MTDRRKLLERRLFLQALSHASTRAEAVHVGCSGWHYKSWRRVVYPENLSTDEWLGAYSRLFATVELNSRLYRLPSATTFAAEARAGARNVQLRDEGQPFLTHIKRRSYPDRVLSEWAA